MVACTQSNSIESSLQLIQFIISTANTNNDVHYRLSYDVDYPCKIQLQESWQDTTSYWQQKYRFDLTDIEPNTFIQSKSDRKAIIYSGYKKSSDDTVKEFSEKQINNIRYRASLTSKDQRQIIDEMNKAITLCEEEYSF